MYTGKRTEGFSLIEMLIATVILCTIIPLTSYFVNSIKTNNKTEVQQTANHLVQKYMETYKAKDLATFTAEDYKTVDPETGLNVYVKVELESVKDLSVGEIRIEDVLGANTEIKMGNKSTDPQFSVNDNEILSLRIKKNGSVEELQLKKKSGGSWKSINLENVTPESADRIIKLELKNDPKITINAENKLSQWVIFNIENDSPNFVLNREGKISSVNSVASSERGATVTVTVKDKNDSEELAKAAQNRKF